MARLTEDKIKRLKWDASKPSSSGRQSHSDSEIKGFHIRVYRPKEDGTSTKAFYLAYGPATNRKFHKIGQWGHEWSLKDARERAGQVRKEYFSTGRDPNQVKQDMILSHSKRPTVNKLVADYLGEKKSVWKPKYMVNNERHAKVLAANVGASLADSITLDDAKKMFLAIKKKTPPSAKLFNGFCVGLYNWAMDHEKIPSMRNPFKLELSSGQKSPFTVPARPRERVCEHKKGEATQLLDMLESHNHMGIDYQNICKLYVLTGFRNRELRTANWEDVDMSERTLYNSSPKYWSETNDNSYKVYLCDTAYEILQGLGDGNIRFRKGPIFPPVNSSANGIAGKARTHWHRWDKNIANDPRMPKCSDEGHIKIHDLRRTATTWLQLMGESVDNVTIFKGSKTKGVTQHAYMHGKEDIRKRCALMVEQCLQEVIAGNETTMFDEALSVGKANG